MRRISFIPVLPLILLFVILNTGSSSAAFFDTAPQEELDGMSGKLVRGIANTATGWGELPKQIIITWKEDGAARGIFVGPLKGIGMTIVRTISGVAEIVTFYLPVPQEYKPYFEPEFVWQKE
ncbi:exosortase system-associated protein, TIGR04073 family [Malonomonas rubra]|uniref:exosortase system-associated protein, TIGR04073 family n=1 Tax=Malonomonas rubra TaxID=57040 RepID=UPI0026EC03CF|nr:exosortase system-associated protein, TIGR04073 family [Malonomonas rubra]